MKIIALTLLLLGCGTSEDSKTKDEHFSIDNEFVEFVADYEQSFGRISFSLTFSDIMSVQGRTGECLTSLDGSKREVRILTEGWKAINYYQRWVLIYHELTHCNTLIMEHDDRVDSEGHVISIMTSTMPYPFEAMRIYDYKEKYIAQLLQYITVNGG